jgi:hypothetical protein
MLTTFCVLARPRDSMYSGPEDCFPSSIQLAPAPREADVDADPLVAGRSLMTTLTLALLLASLMTTLALAR